MPWMEIEPTISAGERPQTYALDQAATATDNISIIYGFYWFIKELVMWTAEQ
jgi:hypothetical protein